MKDLIARLAAATGPDREIDARIWAEHGYSETGNDDYDWRQNLPIRPEALVNGMSLERCLALRFTDCGRTWNVPPLTASIDAAVALVEAKRGDRPLAWSHSIMKRAMEAVWQRPEHESDCWIRWLPLMIMVELFMATEVKDST